MGRNVGGLSLWDGNLDAWGEPCMAARGPLFPSLSGDFEVGECFKIPLGDFLGTSNFRPLSGEGDAFAKHILLDLSNMYCDLEVNLLADVGVSGESNGLPFFGGLLDTPLFRLCKVPICFLSLDCASLSWFSTDEVSWFDFPDFRSTTSIFEFSPSDVVSLSFSLFIICDSCFSTRALLAFDSGDIATIGDEGPRPFNPSPLFNLNDPFGDVPGDFRFLESNDSLPLRPLPVFTNCTFRPISFFVFCP